MSRLDVSAVEPLDDEWLVIIDPQAIFADPTTSQWGSPMWAETVPRIARLATAYPGRVVVTRFVADPGLGGSWASYYDEWGFALVPDEDPLYAVVPELAHLADHMVTEPTFGKWGQQLRSVIGDQPRLALAGVATDCCVIATALPAGDAGANIRVVAEACAGSSPEAHERALGAMEMFAPQITVL
ncbi:cysteine hydrolase family protein [Knoellia subterranea]|uniref:Hydrolase n=1 Tax=Knoellia subterranea KCTC 19937 TaxID=1385521 RepID=A0A0A0JGG4_9MICO|nr:cysteine hydrolase [Knoellia subterranea]KGN36228.1 hydrolase [Knoellia subterranea KCTC 19937]